MIEQAIRQDVKAVVLRAIDYTIKRYEVCTIPVHDMRCVEAANDVMQAFTEDDMVILRSLLEQSAY